LIGELGLSFRHRILVRKKAVLNFARRHRLPGPSWWVDKKARTPKENAADARLVTPAVATPSKRRRGPEPGSVDRFGESDRALFPELKRIMRDHRMSDRGSRNGGQSSQTAGESLPAVTKGYALKRAETP
jgi:hypothetical protein